MSYFAASSPRGQPDFSAADRLEAEKLLASEHIIQERVVSDAGSRAARFEDCNRESCASAMCWCACSGLMPPADEAAAEMFSLALSHGRKVLEVRVGLTEGRAKVVCEWHGPKGFPVPALPKSIETLSLTPKPEQETGAAALPSVAEFCAAVKEHTSAQAKRHHGLFSRAALVVIATHVLATLCATVALASHGSHDAKAESMIRAAWWICALLVLELILLVAGLKTHLWLHHAKSLKALGCFPSACGNQPLGHGVRGFAHLLWPISLRRACRLTCTRSCAQSTSCIFARRARSPPNLGNLFGTLICSTA